MLPAPASSGASGRSAGPTKIAVTLGKPFAVSPKAAAAGPVVFDVRNAGTVSYRFAVCAQPTPAAPAAKVTTCAFKTTPLLKPGKSSTLVLKAATKGSYRYYEYTTPASNEFLKPPKSAGAGMSGAIAVSGGAAAGGGAGGQVPAAGAAIFKSKCGSCHALAAAKTRGGLGRTSTSWRRRRRSSRGRCGQAAARCRPSRPSSRRRRSTTSPRTSTARPTNNYPGIRAVRRSEPCIAAAALLATIGLVACGGASGGGKDAYTLSATRACLDKAGFRTATVHNIYFPQATGNLRVRLTKGGAATPDPEELRAKTIANQYVFLVFAKDAAGARAFERKAVRIAVQSLKIRGLSLRTATVESDVGVRRNVFYYSTSRGVRASDRAKFVPCLR